MDYAAGSGSNVSFAGNHDILTDDDDFMQVGAAVIEHSAHFDDEESSHSEGDDQLGPMEGENQNPKETKYTKGYVNASVRTDTKLRTSLKTDLATGIQGGARAHKALVRPNTSTLARSTGSRRRRNVLHIFNGAADKVVEATNHTEDALDNLSIHGRLQVSSRQMSHVNQDTDIEQGNGEQKQFRLEAVKTSSHTPRVLKWLGFGDGGLSIYEESPGVAPLTSCWGLNVNNFVMKYLHWTHRSSFGAVFLSAAVAFFCITIFFALCIWGLGKANPSCIGGVDFESDFFVDAYALSWTTFSTVGYGAISSGVSAGEPDIKKCTGMTIIVTVEAFVGILFGSMCGAILFAKVARIQSFAQVIFSDPIVIRYGSGVVTESDDASDDGSSSLDTDIVHIQCPVLEFRICNRLNSTKGGEIIDASLNIVASIDASQACVTVRNATKRRRRGRKGKKRGPRQRGPVRQKDLHPNDANPKATPPVPPYDVAPVIKRNSSEDSLQSLAKNNGAVQSVGKTHQAFDEDPTGHLVPKRIFSKLEIESPDHPFFKRVWMVRHTLNHYSPLLKTHARELVKQNNGYWPIELNSHEGVRGAIHFDQILVSLSGTSNADANSVYGQKVYDFIDMNVGYRFVNQLYRDPMDGSLRVDNDLVNDVLEQSGGGGEPFQREDGEKMNMNEMFVL